MSALSDAAAWRIAAALERLAAAVEARNAIDRAASNVIRLGCPNCSAPVGMRHRQGCPNVKSRRA